MPTSTSALPGTTILNLPIATTIDGSEYVPIVQGGTTKRTNTLSLSIPASVSVAAFVMASSNNGFAGERKLTAQPNVTTVTDGGAGGDITVGIASSGIGTTELADLSVTTSKISSLAVTTDKISSNAVTNAKLRQSAGLSVIGNPTAALGDVSDVIGTTDQVLRVSSAGNSLVFGAVNLASSLAVSNTLATEFGGTGLSTIVPSQLLAGGTVSSGIFQQIAASTGVGFVLTNVSSTALPTFQAPATGTGTVVNSSVGQFAYYSSNGTSVTGSSYLSFRSSVLTISRSSSPWTPTNTNSMLHLIGSSAGVEVSIEMQSFNTDVVYLGARANGSPTAPTALLSSNQINSIISAGHDGVAMQQGGLVGIFADSNWSSTNHGCEVRMYTIATNSTTFFNSVRFLGSGGGYVTKQQTATAPSTVTTVPVWQMVGANSAYAYNVLDSFGTGVAPFSVYRAARGVSSAFTAVQSGDALGGLAMVGANAANTFSSPVIGIEGGAFLVGQAIENWSSAAQGTAFVCFTTPAGTNVVGTAFAAHGSGGFSVGLSGTANDPGAGNMAARNAVIVGSTAPITAGGASSARVRFGSTAVAGPSIYFGSGAPTLTANQGSIYLRTDGTGVNGRLYVNTAGSSIWIGFTSTA